MSHHIYWLRSAPTAINGSSPRLSGIPTPPLFKCSTLCCPSLPGGGLLLQQFGTLVEACAIIVTRMLNKFVVLQQFLGHGVRQVGFELLVRNLLIVGLLARNFLKICQDLLCCVVGRGSQNVLAGGLGLRLDGSIYEFAFCIDVLAFLALTIRNQNLTYPCRRLDRREGTLSARSPAKPESKLHPRPCAPPA